MNGHRGMQKQPMTKGQKIGIGIAVFCGVSVLVAIVDPQKTTTTAAPSTQQATATKPSPSRAASAPEKTPAKPTVEPTFVYPGDPQCAITYRDRGDGSMSWTATVTVAGELITHAGDSAGNLYSHDVQVTPGPNAFAAPVPLSQITDIGGNLTAADGTSYGCSVAPQH